ncbi:MAG: rhodoquinone biosynthesis methyltransferase RquA [Alphaproteobacteria bacterium]|nr:rhodoquinone biosynthesis methyltransferase RquA [Alphaproteobacteria bacterium]
MPNIKANVVKNSKIVKEPPYLRELYAFIYKNKSMSRFLDDERIQSILSLGAKKILIEDLLEDIGTNSSVLQIGCTFGSQMQKTADKIGRYGSYVVADVLPVQIERCREQLIDKKIDFEVMDARKPFSSKYDTVLCFMLLHELPETSREKVVNNALDAVKEGGKAIFIDYNMPSKYNLLRFFLKPFNRLYFPFTENLWYRQIRAYAHKENHFAWYKKTYRAKMFQKVVAVRKVADEKKPETKPSFY